MTSREKILSAVKLNQPNGNVLNRRGIESSATDVLDAFTKTLHAIGGSLYVVNSTDEINDILSKSIPGLRKVYSTHPQIFNGTTSAPPSGHGFADLDLCVLRSQLAVAENGAVWLSDAELPQRALPFIAQHLAVVVSRKAIVENMHHAYDVIGDRKYDYGVFIAGPSKTADIEQSLVMGAHGAMSMTIFILPE